MDGVVYEKEIFGAEGKEDDLGVVTHSIPYYATNLSECRTVAKGRVVDGLPEKSRSWQAHAGRLFKVTVIYEGQESPDNNPKVVRYSLRGSLEEEPLEAHPEINDLAKKYGGRWEGNRVIFPPTYQEDTSSSVGLYKGEKEEKKNPLCGVEKYKRLSVIWQVTYAAKSIPARILAKVGKIVSSPPGAPPEMQGRSNWLVLDPNADQRGNVVEITEQYLLLDDEDSKILYK